MSDLISRRAAIETALKMYELWNEAYIERVMLFTDEYRDMVVESLKVLPSAQPEHGEDAVSRSWLLTEYDKRHKGAPGGARKLIEEAPSVQPERKIGMICMGILWFWHDLKHSDYERGYLDGCHDTAELLGEEDDEP